RFDRVALVSSLLALALWVAWPGSTITGLFCGLAALLNFARLIRWQGWHAWREPLVLVLHTSYAFVPLGLATIAAATFGLIGTISALHVLTVGAIANMTLAVMTRASRGHTGNALTASA